MLHIIGAEQLLEAHTADTGHGIEEKFFTTIFERFYHHEADTQDAGVGIGLALSKGIVELHGGRIGVESVPDEGSTFWFTLPLRPVGKAFL